MAAYKTLGYALEYLNQWWVDEDDNRNYLVGTDENGDLIYKSEDGYFSEVDLDIWFSDENRPESKANRVIIPQCWVVTEIVPLISFIVNDGENINKYKEDSRYHVNFIEKQIVRTYI